MLIAGLGGALGYTPSMVVLGYNFHKRRNMVMGIGLSGIGIGLTLLAPLMNYIYNMYGSFGFFLLLSGIYSHSILSGVIFFPSKLEQYTKSRRRLESCPNKQTAKICESFKNHVLIFTNKAVACLSFGLFCFCLGSYLVFMHLPNYVVEKGFAHSLAANLVSMTGVLTVFGRIVTGVLAFKYVREDILYCIPMLILGILTIVYPYMSSTLTGNVTFTVFLGLFYGNVYVLNASVSVKYVGIVNLAKALGIQYFFSGLGILLGPIVAGM